MFLPDYTYIDVAKVVDYLSRHEPGVVEEFTERIRSNSGTEISGGINFHALKLGGKGGSGDETETEQTVKIYAQHMFSRLYDKLKEFGAIQSFGVNEAITAEELRKSSVVEVTREFHPSPLNQRLSSLLTIMDMMEGLGLGDELGDGTEMQQVTAVVGLLQGRGEVKELPMFARADGQDAGSVIFVARDNFLLIDEEEFSGEMTLLGKVREVIPPGSSVDLLDLVKILPPGVRQTEALGNEFKSLLRNMMDEWPREFGGPIAHSEVIVKGPAVILTPVAAYAV